MNEIERKIEEALMRRSTDVRAEPGAWNEIERGLRRSNRTRTIAGALAAAAVVVASALVIPRLVGGDAPSVPPANPGGSPSPAPTTVPASPQPAPGLPAGWSYLRHETDGYRIMLPDAWKSGWFEGQTSYRPPGLGSAEEGADTFTVEIFVEHGEQQIKPEGTPTRTTVAGRPATRYEREGSEGDWTAHTVVDAWECWAGPGAVAKCTPATLHAIVRASTDDLRRQWAETGERIVASLRKAADPMPADAHGWRTLHGRVDRGVEYDLKVYTVTRFMDARVFGDTDTAESFLTTEAREQYASHRDGLDLYGPDSSRGLRRYTVTSKEGADASSDEITVELFEFSRGDGKPDSRAIETLGVGPGDNAKGVHMSAVIRFATRRAA